MAKQTNYKDLSVEDLNARLVGIKEELHSAHFNFRLGKFKKTSDFRRLRKEIARVNTYLAQRKAERKDG